MTNHTYVLNCGHEVGVFSADAAQRLSPGDPHPCGKRSCKGVYTVVKRLRRRQP